MKTAAIILTLLSFLFPATLWAQETDETEHPCEISDSSFVYTRLINNRITQVKAILATSDTLQANRLYLHTDSLLETYLHCLKNLNRKCLNHDGLLIETGLSPKGQQFLAHLKECNIEIRDIGEGQSDLLYTPFFYYDLFKDYVSKDFRDFLKIKGRQNAGVFSADAAIVIPWEEIGQYVMDWEIFMNNYPESFFRETAADEHFRYLQAFLFGDYNSPVLDESQTINKDIRPVFDAFLKKYPDSYSAEILEYYLEEIENNGGRAPADLQQKVNTFIEQTGVSEQPYLSLLRAQETEFDVADFYNSDASSGFYNRLNSGQPLPDDLEILEYLQRYESDSLIIRKTFTGKNDTNKLEIKVVNPCKQSENIDEIRVDGIINYIVVRLSNKNYSDTLIYYNPNVPMSLIHLEEEKISLKTIAGKQAVFIPFAYCMSAGDDDIRIAYIVFYDNQKYFYHINLSGQDFANYKITDNLDEKFKDLPSKLKKEFIQLVRSQHPAILQSIGIMPDGNEMNNPRAEPRGIKTKGFFCFRPRGSGY